MPLDEEPEPLALPAAGEAPIAAIVSAEPPPHELPLWLGLLALLLVALASKWVALQLNGRGITVGPLTIALLVGIFVGNVQPTGADAMANAVNYAKKNFLRAGIVLYGFRLTLADFQSAGLPIVLIDSFMVCTTFALALWIGIRLLGMDRETAALIGSGSAICGASAVLTTAPVIGAKPARTSIAISTVAVFGTVALLTYPFLFRANASLAWLPGGEKGFGIFIGSTVHEVGQVVAISSAAAASATDAAVLTKMVRVAMLLPFLMGVAWWWHGSKGEDVTVGSWRKALPWYPVFFAVIVCLNSWLPMPAARPVFAQLDELALASAMAALGLSTRIAALREAGAKPLLLAGALFVWLVLAGGAINIAVSGFAGSL